MAIWYATQAEQWGGTPADQWDTIDIDETLLSAIVADSMTYVDIDLSPVLPKMNPVTSTGVSMVVYETGVYPENAIIRYSAVLGDLTIPIKSFTASRSAEDGGTSYLNVVTYHYDYLSEIESRVDENLSLKKSYEVGGSIVRTDTIMTVENIIVDHSEGGKSKTITLSGKRTEYFIPKGALISESYISRQYQAGKINASYYTINPDINPGDTLIIDSYNVTVGRISMNFSFSENGSTVTERMTITEK